MDNKIDKDLEARARKAQKKSKYKDRYIGYPQVIPEDATVADSSFNYLDSGSAFYYGYIEGALAEQKQLEWRLFQIEQQKSIQQTENNKLRAALDWAIRNAAFLHNRESVEAYESRLRDMREELSKEKE